MGPCDNREGQFAFDALANQSSAGFGRPWRSGIGNERDFFAGRESLDQLRSAHCFVVLVITQHRFVDPVMLQQNPGVPGVLGRDKIDIFQNFQRPQGDVSKISNWSSDDVKHLVNLIKPTCLTRNERYTEGIIYENTHLDVGAGAVRVNWLRRGNAAGYDHDNYDHPRGDDGSSNHWRGNARGCGSSGSASGAC